MSDSNNNSGMKSIDFFMLGFGSMIGVGWTVSLNNWFYTAGGVFGTILAFLVGTLLVIPIGLCYGEMTSALPVSGGAMAFAYRAEGSRLSFLGGWLTTLAYIVLLPWELIYINHILGKLFPILTSGLPLYTVLGFDVYLGQLASGLLLTLLMFFINLKGAEVTGKWQTRLTTTILLSAAIIIISVLFKAKLDNLFPIYQAVEGQEHSNFFGGFISMLVIVPFFMAGFDAIPQAIEDAEDGIRPRKISKIIILAIACAGLFYIIIVATSALAIPWREFMQLDSPALAFLFKEVFPYPLGSLLYYITILGALAGLLSTYNGMFIAATKLLHSMGRSHLLPNIFSNTTKSGAPITAITFCGLATLIGPIFGTSVITPLTNVGSLAFVCGWLITCYSTLALRENEKNLQRPILAGKNRNIIKLSIVISAVLILLTILPFSPGFMSYNSLIIFVFWIILGFFFHFISENTGENISELERYGLMFQEVDLAPPPHIIEESNDWL